MKEILIVIGCGIVALFLPWIGLNIAFGRSEKLRNKESKSKEKNDEQNNN